MTNDATKTDNTPSEPMPAPTVPQAEETAQPTDADENAQPNKEAAKYRRQLREVEAERDALLEQLKSAHGSMLTTVIDGLRVKNSMQLHPSAHADVFPDPNTYFNDDGTVNGAAVSARLEDAYATHPHYFQRNLTGTGIVLNPGGTPDLPRVSQDSFMDAFAPKPY